MRWETEPSRSPWFSSALETCGDSRVDCTRRVFPCFSFCRHNLLAVFFICTDRCACDFCLRSRLPRVLCARARSHATCFLCVPGLRSVTYPAILSVFIPLLVFHRPNPWPSKFVCCLVLIPQPCFDHPNHFPVSLRLTFRRVPTFRLHVFHCSVVLRVPVMAALVKPIFSRSSCVWNPRDCFCRGAFVSLVGFLVFTGGFEQRGDTGK